MLIWGKQGKSALNVPECTQHHPIGWEKEQASRAPILISASWPTEMWARCCKLMLTGTEAGPAAIPSLSAGLDCTLKLRAEDKPFLSCLLLLSLWSQNTNLANAIPREATEKLANVLSHSWVVNSNLKTFTCKHLPQENKPGERLQLSPSGKAITKYGSGGQGEVGVGKEIYHPKWPEKGLQSKFNYSNSIITFNLIVWAREITQLSACHCGDRWTTGAHWPAGLAYSVSLDPKRDPVSTNKVFKKWQLRLTYALQMHTYMCAYTLTHTHASHTKNLYTASQPLG